MKREDRKISHAVLLTLLSALQGVIGTVTPEITDSELRGCWNIPGSDCFTTCRPPDAIPITKAAVNIFNMIKKT